MAVLRSAVAGDSNSIGSLSAAAISRALCGASRALCGQHLVTNGKAIEGHEHRRGFAGIWDPAFGGVETKLERIERDRAAGADQHSPSMTNRLV